MSKEEEQRLGRIIQDWKSEKDKEVKKEKEKEAKAAIEILVAQYTPMVKKEAGKIYRQIGSNSRVDIEDMVQNGMIGLLKAIEDYNPDLTTEKHKDGFKLGTFAFMRIKKEMSTELTKNRHIVRPTEYILHRYSLVMKAEEEYDRIYAEASFDVIKDKINNNIKIKTNLEETKKKELSKIKGDNTRAKYMREQLEKKYNSLDPKTKYVMNETRYIKIQKEERAIQSESDRKGYMMSKTGLTPDEINLAKQTTVVDTSTDTVIGDSGTTIGDLENRAFNPTLGITVSEPHQDDYEYKTRCEICEYEDEQCDECKAFATKQLPEITVKIIESLNSEKNAEYDELEVLAHEFPIITPKTDFDTFLLTQEWTENDYKRALSKVKTKLKKVLEDYKPKEAQPA